MKKIITCWLLLITSFAYGCKNETPETDVIQEPETTIEESLQTEELSEETIKGMQEVEKYEQILDDDSATKEDCSEIENEELKSTCEQKFLYEEAVDSKDTTICGQLENQTDQETCVSEINNGL